MSVSAAADFERHPDADDRRNDVLLGAAILVGTLLSGVLSSTSGIYGDEQAPLASVLVLAPVIGVAIMVRRRWPNTVAVVVSAAYFLAVSLRVPELYVGNIAMFISIYTVGAWVNDRRRAMLVRAAIIVGMFVWLVAAMYRDAMTTAEQEDIFAGALSPFIAFMLLQLLLNMLYFGGAYYFGERSWSAARSQQMLQNRTAELARERELTAAQAVALDRVRIARELHDVVAHHVSVLGVQAGAARMLLDNDPRQASALLERVEASARDAITDFRQLLESLRQPGEPSDDTVADVSLADIEQLVEQSQHAGIPTSFRVIGDAFALAPLAEVNLYRIAQEALTNARRHGGAHVTADVRLRYGNNTVELDVINTGRSVVAPRAGLGLLGMRERALASGGELDIVPRREGGLVVRARVPRGEAVAS
ncbi:sensor histidine kinase [Microbacterium sp. YY-01]|uniref:sensor histidine kinase n=1 Tax=Microbacterium sp. YY-01 TaxID=3421634 RepID=UPI003D173166